MTQLDIYATICPTYLNEKYNSVQEAIESRIGRCDVYVVKDVKELGEAIVQFSKLKEG